MLVLGRKKEQTFSIYCPDGTVLKFKIADVRRTEVEDTKEIQVRIGIEAPETYIILRDELRKDGKRDVSE